MKFATSAVAILVATSQIVAQDQASDDYEGEFVVEEITVTALKRSQSLQDVAAAVNAVSGSELREQAIGEARDLFQRLPNVSVASNNTAGQVQLSIRGVNFLSFSPVSVQPVMFFVDEVVYNSPITAGFMLFDLERVEVLRGPQNTLYGRNATGGAVNFVTRKPVIGEDVGGYLDVSYGRFESVNVNGAIGGSLSDTTAFRLAVQSSHTEGPFENVNIAGDRMGERDQTLVKGQFAWQPSDAFDLRLELHGGASRGGQRGMKGQGQLDPGGAGLCSNIDVNNLNTNCVDFFDNPTIRSNTQVSSELQNDRDDIEMFGGSLTMNYEFDGVTLTSISAYEENTFDHWEDAEPIPVPFVLFRQKSDTQQYSQEFRLTSSDDQSVRWIAGAFGLWEDTKFQTAVPIALFDPAASFSDNNLVDHDTTALSAFVRFDADLSDVLTLTGGVRYAYEEKEGRARYQFAVGLDALDVNNPDAFLWENLINFAVPGSRIDAEFGQDWDMWGGELSLEYRPNDDALYYGRISRGVKAGQFTDAPDAIANGGFFLPANPEIVVGYEFGAKNTFAGGRIVTNLALFYNDYQNQQQQVSFAQPDGAVVSTVVNVASSETYGAEFDARFYAAEGLTLDFAATWLETNTLEDSLGALTGGAQSVRVGRGLVNAPQWIITGDVNKDFSFDNGSELSFNLNARYTSSRNYDLLETATNPLYVTDPSYFLLNASIVYKFGSEQQYRMSVFGRNLTNELYFMNLQDFDIGTNIGFVGDPLTWGVSLGVDF